VPGFCTVFVSVVLTEINTGTCVEVVVVVSVTLTVLAGNCTVDVLIEVLAGN